MLFLVATNQVVELITSAAADIEVIASYADNNAGVITPGGSGPMASITTATTTPIVAAPASSQQRSVLGILVRNVHASTACDVTFRVNNSTNTVDPFKCTLLAGESCGFNESIGFWHKDSNGGEYPAIGNAAAQSDMEAGTSTTLFVTPNAMKWHPGVNKFWGLMDAAGALTAGYNLDSHTDNCTGDITVNITTDFSSASWCASVTVEMTATTYAVANARTGHVRFGGQAAGTLRCDCIDGTATTQLVKDPTKWHIAGWGDQ